MYVNVIYFIAHIDCMVPPSVPKLHELNNAIRAVLISPKSYKWLRLHDHYGLKSMSRYLDWAAMKYQAICWRDTRAERLAGILF